MCNRKEYNSNATYNGKESKLLHTFMHRNSSRKEVEDKEAHHSFAYFLSSPCQLCRHSGSGLDCFYGPVPSPTPHPALTSQPLAVNLTLASHLQPSLGQKEVSQHQEPTVLSQQCSGTLHDAGPGSKRAAWSIRVWG